MAAPKSANPYKVGDHVKFIGTSSSQGQYGVAYANLKPGEEYRIIAIDGDNLKLSGFDKNDPGVPYTFFKA